MSETLRDLVVSLSLQTDNFTRNMQSVNKQIKEAESSFKLASAGVDKFDQDASALGSQLGALQSKLTLQKTAVDQYTKALQAAREKLLECYNRQNDYSRRLEEAKTQHDALRERVSRTAAQYKEYVKTLGEADSATIAAKANLDALKGEYSDSAAELRKFGCYVRTRSQLNIEITAGGAQGSTISSYRTNVNGTTYTSSNFTTGYLNTAGDNTITVTVTDSRGRTTTLSNTITVADYSPPSLTKFTAERSNSDGSAAQTDGSKVRVSIAGTVSPVGNKNNISCTVYYKLTSASAWTSAGTITPNGYSVSVTNQVLAQTFAVLSSYDIKVRFQDYFYYVEQSVSIGTKQVIMDFLHDGKGIAFGKVAESSEHVEFGWPLILSSPLAIEYGGTGATTPALARYYLGAVAKTGDTMTGNLTIQNALYPSVYLLPTYNNTTNRTVFEGSYVGASSFAAWEDSTGNNRRMLEVRTKSYESSLDNAVMVRVADNGTWSNYRVFHAGMVSGVPVNKGGTGATTAKAALSNLGIFYSATLPSSGTDGQICLVPV